ncbi:MAG: class I tRNA ligase family protein, partial [Arsenophonus sp. NC-QC1-MAG3]
VLWIAPILSFTADEIWQKLPGKHGKYVFTEEYYSGLFNLDVNETLNDEFWSKLLIIRSEVNKILEQARAEKLIHSSLEATVILYADTELAEILNRLGDELRFVLLTSKAKVINIIQTPVQAHNSELSGLKIAFQQTEGDKCPRCW